MKFYVYEHWRPDLDVCFYVGKGHGSRAQRIKRRNPYHTNIVNKLAHLGMCVEVCMVENGLGEQEAFSLEKTRIAFWKSRGVKLTNRTDGGEGTSGVKASKKIRDKARETLNRLWADPLFREKMIQVGRAPISDQGRRNMSAAQKKRFEGAEAYKQVSEHCAKIALSRAGKPGKPQSEEARRKLSASRLGILFSDDHREKLRQKKLGIKRKPFTEETIRKMREASILREAKKRLSRSVVPGL